MGQLRGFNSERAEGMRRMRKASDAYLRLKCTDGFDNMLLYAPRVRPGKSANSRKLHT